MVAWRQKVFHSGGWVTTASGVKGWGVKGSWQLGERADKVTMEGRAKPGLPAD